MATISYQPWYVSQTFPIWDIPLATDAGGDDLTGVNVGDISLIFRNTAVTPFVDTVGTGTITIHNVNPGELYYKPSTADVASAFSGMIIIKILFPPSHSATDEVRYDGIPFVISA